MAPAPDVVVVGGGIIGVSAAAHLAEAGARVVLVERDDIAAGASGRNSGVVQHPLDPVLVALHLETLQLYRRLAAAVPAFRLPEAPAGLLYVTHRPEVARTLADEIAAQHPALEPTFLSPAEVASLEPTLRPDVAACRLAIGFPVGPATATRAYAELARRHGVLMTLGAPALIRTEGGRVAGVDVAGRQIAAGAVVVAAGPWTPGVLDPSGSWSPIRPYWGAVAHISLADPPGHVLEEAEIDAEIEPGEPGLPAVPLRPSVAPRPDDDDVPGAHERGLAFSLVTAEGSTSLGSSFRPHEPDPARLLPAIRSRGARFVPAVGDAPVLGLRACARPLSADGRPLVGAVPWLDRAFVAAGHGPWGISTGPASGRLVADLVLGRNPPLPGGLDPARFGIPAHG